MFPSASRYTRLPKSIQRAVWAFLGSQRWVAARASFLRLVRVPSRLFFRLFLAGLMALYAAGQLAFFGEAQNQADQRAFLRNVAPPSRSSRPSGHMPCP